jgi:hypothetical protein
MGKKSRSESGIRIRDKHRISESLVTIFWVKIIKFFDAYPDPGIFLTLDPGWEKFGSGINIPDPQHTGGMQSNLLNGDPQVFLNIRQVLGLVVPHAAALSVTAAMNYYRKF